MYHKISDPYQEASYKERLAFKNWRNLYNLFPEEEWTVFITPYDGSDVYDVLVQNNLYKRIIIEIKIRNEFATKCGLQDGFIYETKKHKSLTQVKDLDPQNNSIMYINFTSNGTYVWNICKLDLVTIKKEMNKATMSSTDDKEDKKVYLLKAEDAKFYPYIYDDAQYWNDKVNIDKTVKLSNMVKQYRCDIKFPWDE